MSRTERQPGNRDRCGQAGFTLIEMLVVLGIVGLITAMIAPQVVGYVGRAKTDTTRIEIENLGTALDMFRLDVGRYPTEREGLAALVAPPGGPGGLPGWSGPYLRKSAAPVDPWGRPYGYRFPGQHGDYDLYSLGADNGVGGTGENRDVANR